MTDTKTPTKADTKADTKASGDIITDPQAKAEVEAGVRHPTGGTTQLEPKPEDYPASAKVTPPAEQLNSALSQVVGHAAPPQQGESASVDSDSIAKGAQEAEASQANVRKDVEAEFERRREFEKRHAA